MAASRKATTVRLLTKLFASPKGCERADAVAFAARNKDTTPAWAEEVLAEAIEAGRAIKAGSLLTPYTTPIDPAGDEPVILNWGMGVDSSAIITRLLTDPAFDWIIPRLIVLVAQTGDEYEATIRLGESYILPLLRERGVRLVEISRAGPSIAKDGITVHQDTRSPERLHGEGDFKLSDEGLESGTGPTKSGTRKCSIKSKGEPLDHWIAHHVEGHFHQIMGYEANEPSRAARDVLEGVSTRHGSYPLIEWGWDRAYCIDYLRDHYGVTWLKSACGGCPFSDPFAKGGCDTIARWEGEPSLGARAIWQNCQTVAFNGRQGLYGEGKTAKAAAEREGATRTLAAFSRIEASYRDDWALYLVKRAWSAPAVAARSLTVAEVGTKDEMLAALRAKAGGGDLEDTGVGSAWNEIPKTTHFPSVSVRWAAAPLIAEEKEKAGFAKSWAKALANDGRMAEREAA